MVFNQAFNVLLDYQENLKSFTRHYYDYLRFLKKKHLILAKEAVEAQRKKARTFKTAVGAAVETIEGKIFSAANIENLSRCQDDHAEKRALARAMEEGFEQKDIIALCLVYGDKSIAEGDYAYPACGACRQYIWENANPQTQIMVADPISEEIVFAAPLKLLYPLPYPKWEDIPRRIKKAPG